MKAKETLLNRARFLFFMPSFYGALIWGFWLTLYLIRVINWNDDDPVSVMIYCCVEISFIASIFAFSRPYQTWLDDHLRLQTVENKKSAQGKFHRFLIVVFHAMGFFGVYQYARDFGAAAAVGGLGGFWDQTMNEAWRTRAEAEYMTSLGTQMGYVGWIAIAITVFEVVRGRISRWWLVPALVQFAGNLLWVGRMRPVTILFICLMMAMVAFRAPRVTMAVKWAALGVGGIVVLFWSIAIWVGKIGPWTGFNLPNFQNVIENIELYGTGSFAYFNQMVIHGTRHAGPLENTLYPMYKVLATFNLTSQPPSQIKLFMSMPLSTNVSTFLDPFFRDGGFPLVFLGIIIQSFGVDALGLSLLRKRNAVCYFGWAALGFTSFMTFFTFKICEFPTWLFVGISLAAAMLTALLRQEVKRAPLAFGLSRRNFNRNRPPFKPRSMQMEKPSTGGASLKPIGK